MRWSSSGDEDVVSTPLGLHGESSGPFTPSYQFDYYDDGDGEQGRAPPSRDSHGQPTTRFSDGGGSGRLSALPTEIFVRGSHMDRHIEAAAVSEYALPERRRDYKGRLRVWPGLILLTLLLGAAGFLITYYGLKVQDSSEKRAKSFEDEIFQASKIKGGASDAQLGADIVSDDGVVGNPKKYPPTQCELPNYLSKNGQLVAVSENGTEINLKIKGVNWSGMETGEAVPFGLWDNDQNGTTAYQVASFLADNKFNAVRLPVMAAWILENKAPNKNLINRQENRAINVGDYVSLLKSIIKALQFRNIGVLISMHTLTYDDRGKLWYSASFSEEKFLKSIDILTKNLCSNDYWNVMGIDLKNEPSDGTWGDGGATDFRDGAKRIANRMLEGCPNWLGFVEGVNGRHKVTIDGDVFDYYDWYGGGLQGAKTAGLEFAIKDKVVWAPHYYTPAVYPQAYLYGGGKSTGNAIKGYVELDDDELRRRLKGTMGDMFGFLATETGPALLLGEFGGLYAKDLHPKKTTKRCTDFTIEIIKEPGWAGGFVWSLNPESEYQYNPADTPGQFVEGLVEDDWLNANNEFLKGLAAMDDMDNLRPFPCFKTTGKTP